MAKGRKIPNPSSARDALRAKYREICEKYETLVRRVEEVSTQQLGVFQLGWWALRTSASGLALVRNGGIYLSNNRWRQLDQRGEKDRGWELIATGSENVTPVVHATLRELALHEAGRLLAHRGQFSHVSRYRRLRGAE